MEVITIDRSLDEDGKLEIAMMLTQATSCAGCRKKVRSNIIEKLYDGDLDILQAKMIYDQLTIGTEWYKIYEDPTLNGTHDINNADSGDNHSEPYFQRNDDVV
jgi:hypothetical protein